MADPRTTRTDDPLTAFGPNEWFVDDLYQQYLADKNSVDRGWWEFFADYTPDDPSVTGAPPGNGSNGAATAPTVTATPTTPSTPGTSTATNGTTATNSRPSTGPAPAPTTKPAAEPAAEPAGKPAPAPADAKPAPDQAGTTPDRTKAPSVSKPAPGEAATARREAAPESKPTPRDVPAVKDVDVAEQEQVAPLRGPAARVATNMEASLHVPTATSVRAVPAKLLIDNRVVINNHLARSRGGKISFTHLIGYALVKALRAIPEMNYGYAERDGKPVMVKPAHVNMGLAIDMAKPDGTRQLLVPSIKGAETMDFVHFWSAYEDMVRKARASKLTVEDFQGTSISLTNPGTIGTVHSVPRLMQGQGAIIGVGALEYPAEWQGASTETLNRNAVSKTVTLTSTYDHRIIQGAQSGDFLRVVHSLLLGEQGFYDEIFESLRIPYEPIRWVQDVSASHDEDINKVARVQELIHAYRVRGHLMADTDPLEYRQRRHPDLDVTTHGLTLWDLDRSFATGGFGGEPFLKLRRILGILRDSYCRTVGIEYMHIQDPEQRAWIQAKVEVPYARISSDEQMRILRRLNAAEAFETFLQTKFVGQKRFSLEGGESVIALLDRILSNAANAGMDEVCIGMPHRGRLNVLANIAGKSYGQIFREFEGKQDPKSVQGSGDVKYHLGTEGVFSTEDGSTTKVYLAANPSHLEAVDPVLEGIARAKQDILDKGPDGFTVLPVLMHGDAAFAGQGVVAETLNLSQLRGYRTGGTVHVVVNNQVGFTTSPLAGRSSVYATDVARMVQAPIFHVNGDDPEACVRVARLAYEFRQAFKKDVVIDMVCYRRRGHSEVDEPSFTQPLMYDIIDSKRSVRKIYTEALIGRGDITLDEAEEALRSYRGHLEKAFASTHEASSAPVRRPVMEPADDTSSAAVATAITPEVVKQVVETQTNLPEGFTVHPRLAPQLQRRAKMVGDASIDWAMGELLAFGSLLLEGTPIRLSGQDSRRGTFGQRHAVLVDRATAAEHTPLRTLPGAAPFHAYDSLLSEFAAMGFEYGYAVARPEALVLWEAQFGDFADGAQSIVDEFLSSGEAKWGQRSGLTLLLPHGYEGQGPDHSSARIERYLQLCAEDNMTVAVPSSPAQYFHLLRRQALVSHKRPLVVVTPKSMLRLKAAASGVDEFTSGTWQPVIPDPTVTAPRRVLLCGGKVYYDLVAARAKREDAADVAIVRVEQLYPTPVDEVSEVLASYGVGSGGTTDVVWVQEEPANQGAFSHMLQNLPDGLPEGVRLRRVSRRASASPAAGVAAVHEREQAALVEAALSP